MKAIIWTKYGPADALQLQEVERPVPGEHEVQIKIHAATVNAGDCELRSFKMPLTFQLPFRLYMGLRKPARIKILGQELAGEIEAVGPGVARFNKGDPVFAPTFFRFGAYAEYACLPEKYPVVKPAYLSYEEAATIPVGGVYGSHFVRQANLQPGQKVLIHGAGGSIGTYALQIAKTFGAEVTCVDRLEKLSMLRSAGADRVIDFTREDFTKRGETYDAILDIVGKSSFSGSMRVLKPDGRYILGTLRLPALIRGRWVSRTTGKRVLHAEPGYRAGVYTYLLELMAAGKVKPVIDRRYPLEETAEAHRYVEGGHKKGNVVLVVGHDPVP